MKRWRALLFFVGVTVVVLGIGLLIGQPWHPPMPPHRGL